MYIIKIFVLSYNLSSEDVSNVVQTGNEFNLFDEKNVYLDRLIKANPAAFEEAMNMLTAEAKEIFLEGAEKYGWLNGKIERKIEQNKKEIAKKLLLLGDSVEKVAEATELPIETVMSLQ